MARPHIPDTNAIRSLVNNAEIRFYALAGAIISLAAGLELIYFDLFERATRLLHDTAARNFYQVSSATARRDMAKAAVSSMIAGTSLLDEWDTLCKHIAELTGKNNQRNLLAHARILRQVEQGPVVPSGFLGLTTTSYRVEQDAALILAGKRKPATEDFNSLFIYCEKLIAAWAIWTLF
jgi:hypothetical protein